MAVEAYVTLAATEDSVLGALVLGHSLKLSGTTHHLCAMITPNVSTVMRDRLSKVYDETLYIEPILSTSMADLSLTDRPDLAVSYTKINCWKLTQYTKCVYLDCDSLVLQNVDELFERDELSAAPDVGWPDCFNTGVFVFTPSLSTFNALLNLALTGGGPDSSSGRTGPSFDGGDQGLLNHYFLGWATKDLAYHLPFVYNLVSQAFYSYAPAMKRYGGGAKIVRFVGQHKPWHDRSDPTIKQMMSSMSSSVGDWHVQTPPPVGSEFLHAWWTVFNGRVRPMITAEASAGMYLDREDPCTSIDALSQLGCSSSAGNGSRREDWKRGQIDYMGADKFDNIQRLIDEKISSSNASSGVGSRVGPNREKSGEEGENARQLITVKITSEASSNEISQPL